MAVDTPATIAVLGAGPIGLEATLYARFLGYQVELYERSANVADNVRDWGHVKLFSPFELNRSPLGLAAIEAQNEHYQPPESGDLLTGHEWRERYLLPLAASDLIADCLRLEHEVVGVTRWNLMKHETPGNDERGDEPFRILFQTSAGVEGDSTVDVVIDATGVYQSRRWMGPGGLPAIGERALADQIEYRLPDILGCDQESYADRNTLVVGSGFSAATSVERLIALRDTHPNTQVTWLTRSPVDIPPLTAIDNDPLRERRRLTDTVNQLVENAESPLRYWPQSSVTKLESVPGNGLRVTCGGTHEGEFTFDRIIANTGHFADNRLSSELQLHLCYATGGPMKLAASLLQNANADCLQQAAVGPAVLLNPEPNFYVLGNKSYGSNSHFLVRTGLEQIRDVFRVIGGREDLDLYANAEGLLR